MLLQKLFQVFRRGREFPAKRRATFFALLSSLFFQFTPFDWAELPSRRRQDRRRTPDGLLRKRKRCELSNSPSPSAIDRSTTVMHISSAATRLIARHAVAGISVRIVHHDDRSVASSRRTRNSDFASACGSRLSKQQLELLHLLLFAEAPYIVPLQRKRGG